MNYQSLLNKYSDLLRINLNNSPNLDCEILLSFVLKIKRLKLMLNLDQEISKPEYDNFISLFKQRSKKKPIAYITKQKDFWNSTFFVNKSVLIPRPDTELLVEETLNILKTNKFKNILDIGTGSGCIIISILKEFISAKGTGIDISKDAIKVAKINAKMQHLENRIKFIHSDVDKFLSSKYDLIISNPPYIKKSEIKDLDEDVKNFEPVLALDGGSDGLTEIKKVVKNGNRLLKKNGILILEIANNQFYEVKKILMKKGFYILKISKDLSGKNRCIISLKTK